MPSTSQVHSIIDRLSEEFRDDCLHMLEDCYTAIRGIGEAGTGWKNHLMELQRQIHSIKGRGGTFGFPAISLITHLMEDFMESQDELTNHTYALDAFLYQIREIAIDGRNPEDNELQDILRGLPKAVSHEPRMVVERPSREVSVMLAMPKNVQRKIIGRELLSCGFGLSFNADGIAALKLALMTKPDIIFSSFVLSDMSGVDLICAAHGIKALKNIRYILMTTDVEKNPDLSELPAGTLVLKKGTEFAAPLTEALMDWGFFGDSKAKG